MSLTPEQIASMETLSAPMVLEPRAWQDLTAEQEAAFRLLMPGLGGFDTVQQDYLFRWWLPVTTGQVADLNALMPAGSVLEPRAAADGGLFLGAYLLSDALDDGPLAALLPTLETLPLTYADTITWPAPVVDDAGE